MAELTGAKISRGRLKGSIEKKIHLLKEVLDRIQDIDTGQVSLEQTAELQASLDKTKEALDKYTAAVDRCLALEGGEHDPCLLYTSPSPRDRQKSRMPSSA